jgi:SAM-dependent methyltransferase
VVDRQFAERDLASLYNVFCPWDERGDFGFYLPMIMAADSVLDVGCGTGALLHRARDDGHTGRLCGLDPADGMLAVARTRRDIEWVQGTLADSAWDSEFDLIVMTGHAFQVLVTDDELRRSLAAARTALTDDGRFAFETRNPLAREWESWVPSRPARVVDPTGATVEMAREVQENDGDRVTFTSAYTSDHWPEAKVSKSTLRFLGADALASFLDEAGLTVVEQYGDWDRQPLSAESPEIIGVVRPT